MWIIIILFFAFILSVCLAYGTSEDRKRAAAERVKIKSLRDKYGCSPEELAQKISCSSNVDILAKVIAANAYPDTICIGNDSLVVFPKSKYSMSREINFEDIGIETIPYRVSGIDYVKILAEAICTKLSQRYCVRKEWIDFSGGMGASDSRYCWVLKRQYPEKAKTLNKW